MDAATRILERLIELLNNKEKHAERYFKEFVEPLFRDAEKVTQDYTGLFTELIEKLEQQDNIPEIIKWIEKRRDRFLSLRIKMRGALRAYFPNTRKMDKFQSGLWWLLRGGLTFIEEGHEKLIDDSSIGDHTVLDLLYIWSQEPVNMHRSRYIRNAQRQVACVEKAWVEIREGYEELKKKSSG